MKVGVIFPQTECGSDVGAIAEFVRAVETMGFDHLFVADHVLGADPRVHSHPSLANYSHESVVHESLTLMAYFAAITRRITLATGILILPQRQTVDRKSTRLNSSHSQISYAVFCLKKKQKLSYT